MSEVALRFKYIVDRGSFRLFPFELLTVR